MKPLFATLLVVALLSACSSKPTSAPAPAATAAATADQPVRAADGRLVGPNGHTLYVYAKDKAGSGTSVCEGTCAQNWPPLIAPANARPMGDFTIVTRPDGSRQWAYKGAPLYYFVKDTQPGHQQGHGLGGNWVTARP